MASAQPSLTLYPLSNYSFGQKEEHQEKYTNLTTRNAAMQTKYQKEGVRRTVDALMLVHEHNHPHVLLLQINNAFWRLPGGSLRAGEDDVEGLQRKLVNRLSPVAASARTEWKVGDCVGMFHRPSFETTLYPYLPAHVTRPKEVKKIFLVPLELRCFFAVPVNQKLLAVPLFDLYENSQKYGAVIAGIPQLLSRYRILRSAATPAQPGKADQDGQQQAGGQTMQAASSGQLQVVH